MRRSILAAAESISREASRASRAQFARRSVGSAAESVEEQVERLVHFWEEKLRTQAPRTSVGSTHGGKLALQPRRRCVLTHGHFPKDLMVRYVLAKDETNRLWVVPDVRGELPGRATYVSAHAKALELATKRRAFETGFKNRNINIPVNLEALTRSQLWDNLSELFYTACSSTQSVERIGARDSKLTESAPQTVEEALEEASHAQEGLFANDWLVLPREATLDGDVTVANFQSAANEKLRKEWINSHVFNSFTLDELLGLNETDNDENPSFVKLHARLKEFNQSKKLEDAPVLVNIAEELSLLLRIAQLKMKLFESSSTHS